MAVGSLFLPVNKKNSLSHNSYIQFVNLQEKKSYYGFKCAIMRYKRAVGELHYCNITLPISQPEYGMYPQQPRCSRFFMRRCPSCFTLNACVLNVQYVNNHKSEESDFILTYVICFIRFCRFALNRERERSSEQAHISASVLQVKSCFCGKNIFAKKYCQKMKVISLS